MGHIFIDEGINMIDAKVVLLFQTSHELSEVLHPSPLHGLILPLLY
jgi:hypothetical protein